jgi:hypothetical protein
MLDFIIFMKCIEYVIGLVGVIILIAFCIYLNIKIDK